MKEVYGSAFDTLVGAARAWLLPSAIAVGAFSGLLYPHWNKRGIFAEVESWDATQQAFVAGFTIFVVATVLASSSSPIYRVLEGYKLPTGLKQQWTHARTAEFQALDAQLAQAKLSEVADLHEALDRYPRDPDLIMPTRFGNVLRAGETYGKTQYGLDLLLMWYPLSAVAPDNAVSASEHSRTQVNTWVGAIALSVAFAILSILTASVDGRWAPVSYAVLALATTRPMYGRATAVADRYGRSLRALCDLGRKPLADALALKIPVDRESEVKLWVAVSQFTAWGAGFAKSDDWIATIEEHRAEEQKE